jgi:hypothetical protein
MSQPQTLPDCQPEQPPPPETSLDCLRAKARAWDHHIASKRAMEEGFSYGFGVFMGAGIAVALIGLIIIPATAAAASAASL